MGAVGRLYQPPAALHGLLNLVRSLYAHIVILALRHLPVNLRENKVGRGIPHGMGQLGGRLFLVHFLKPELRFYLAGGRIKAAFLFDHGFLGNFGLRLIRLGRCFFTCLMGFSSFGSARSASENCKRGSLFMPTPPLAVWWS